MCACNGKATPSTISKGIVREDGLVEIATGRPAMSTRFKPWYSFVPNFPSSAERVIMRTKRSGDVRQNTCWRMLHRVVRVVLMQSAMYLEWLKVRRHVYTKNHQRRFDLSDEKQLSKPVWNTTYSCILAPSIAPWRMGHFPPALKKTEFMDKFRSL